MLELKIDGRAALYSPACVHRQVISDVVKDGSASIPLANKMMIANEDDNRMTWCEHY